jgi:eukaryotic-like serine/threonine-protein kinase
MTPFDASDTDARPAPPPPRSLDALVGRRLNDRYVVERKIGEGGFGAVFRGQQVATGRAVALKILHPHNVSDATVVARFRREAEASSKLCHPHTVTIYDFDETEDGTLYIAMELVRGRSLQQLQKAEGPLPPERVLRILDQVAQALGEAHEKGVVHRDMKPENVMVDERDEGDHVKVLDFGIAKIVSDGPDARKPALTAIGQTLGTLEFMSPEQLRGKPLDGRSDLYALGIMAYEMLTGDLPFRDVHSPTEIIQFHLQEEPLPPSKLRPDLRIPGVIDEIVLKMVAKAREDRHADAAALCADIRAARERLAQGWAKRRALKVAAVAGGAALLVALGLLLAR